MSKAKHSNQSVAKKQEKHKFFEKSLLLKQTLLATWKSKLQLIILLLLSAFATALLTGTWISYERIVQEAKYLDLADAKFDAVLPYPSIGQSTQQMADQAFSLAQGRLYYTGPSNTPTALYFDDTRIGREIKALEAKNLNISYTHDAMNIINGVANFAWTNPQRPVELDWANVPEVEASLYGQLMNKAEKTNNQVLKDHYRTAADDLYNKLFVPITANQILDSLQKYFKDWIRLNPGNRLLNNADAKFTSDFLAQKVNYQGIVGHDYAIPHEVDVQADINNDSDGTLATRLVKSTDEDPRAENKALHGMNGQWMRIYRNFDYNKSLQPSVYAAFTSQYNSPYNYNLISDNAGSEQYYSYVYAQAAAALQNRSVAVSNNFVATAFVNDAGQSVQAKVIDLGLPRNNNRPNLKIFEGVMPQARDNIVITPQYARKNGIHPGDKLTINKRDFIVSGIGGDAFNLYPIINSLDPIPNTRTEFIAYVYSDTYNDGGWYSATDKTDTSLMYFLPWNDSPNSGFNVDEFNDFFQKTIFVNNGQLDNNQYDYGTYLINKYLNHQPFDSKYKIQPNLVVTSGDSQFSVYNQGQKMFDSILVGFKYGALGGVLFVVLIVILITYLIVKKAIQKGQVSMGILKSTGYSTWQIVLSYIAYPILVLAIAIPIGWFAGLAVQVYFTEIFNTLFVLPYNVFNFDIIPMFIAIAVIVGFVFVTALLTAYRMLQKEPLMLIKKDSDIKVGSHHHLSWLQRKARHNFKFRFLLSLTKTSWKKILTTASVIGLASLAITGTIAIPATINDMKNNYFKTQKYKNYYQYQTPIPNMPLSKYGLYAWTNLTNPNDEPYYPVSGVMPWADALIINDSSTGQPLAYYNPLEFKYTDQMGSNNINSSDSIVHPYPGVPDSQLQTIKTAIGKYFHDQYVSDANGPLKVDLISWNFSWLGGRAFSNTLITDLAKQDLSPDANFSNSLINFSTNLLPGIIGVPNPGVPPGPNAIIEILKQTLPGYIRQILDNKGPDAYKYFGIGHNSVAYDPDYDNSIKGPNEELVTQFQLGSDNASLANKGFLDVAGINPDTKMLVMNNNLVQGLKYQEADDTIPMVINRAFAAKYNLSTGDQFNAAPNIKTLYYMDTNGNYQPLPKDSWYYGADPSGQTSGNYDIWNKSANKWNYRGTKPIGTTGYNDSFGYIYNGVYNKDGQRVLSDQPNEWNNMNDVWLKLPVDINADALSGTLPVVGGSPTPFHVANIASHDDKWIQPFSFEVTDINAGKPLDPTSLLTSRTPEWYGGMLNNRILKTDVPLHTETIKQDIATNMPTWWGGVIGNPDPVHRYQIIGIQDSYDTARAYVDQRWANRIAGYTYNQGNANEDPTYADGIYQWFSGKLSASDDIYDLVSRISFKRNADDYTLYSTSEGNNDEIELVANSDLLSRKQQMLDKLTDIAFSASALFIITTIVCSALIVVMITDLFTDQFRRFMAQMKSEGYTNWEINSFTLGIFTPWVILGYIAGFLLGFLVVYIFIQLLTLVTSLVLPFTLIWWVIPFSFVIIGGIYISTFIMNNAQLNKMDLIQLLKTDE